MQGEQTKLEIQMPPQPHEVICLSFAQASYFLPEPMKPSWNIIAPSCDKSEATNEWEGSEDSMDPWAATHMNPQEKKS